MTAERKLLILGLLRMTEMHGYILNAHIGSISPVTLKKPTAYNLLERMEQDGWIEHREESTGDRQRKVYSVTKAGDTAFFELLREQLGMFIPNESPGIVSFGFIEALPAAEALRLLRTRRESLAEYRNSLIPAEDDIHDDPHSGSMYLPIEYVRRLTDLDLKFTDEIIEEMEASGRTPDGGHK